MERALNTSSFVEAVERRMCLALSNETRLGGRDGGLLAEASRHLCLGAGGKRMRPRLVLLLGRACGADTTALEDIATSAELIHAASLLHDDVVDEGTMRRGRPTANANWGNAVAVLAGDWLLSTAFTMLESHPRPITTDAIALLARMSRAAVDEVEARGRIELTPAEWRAIAEGKTGALFAWCGQAVAWLAGSPELIPALATFGMRLGVAFQLADDLKDLRGSDDGKDRFADVRNRNPSLPILMSVERSPELRRRIGEAWSRTAISTAEAEELGMTLVKNGAIEAASEALDQEIAAAVAALEPLGSLPWSEDLIGLAHAFAGRPARGEAAA